MRWIALLVLAGCAAAPAQETLDKDGKLVPVYRTDLPHCSEVTVIAEKDNVPRLPNRAPECKL